MQYKYEKEVKDYSDLASGRVFYSLPGHPAFPVRLASEVFQRCIAHREVIYEESGPCTLFDPCCGAAYHLGVLAYLHGRLIRKIIASDIDQKAVAMAKRNLGLLSIEGIGQRIGEITSMLEQYQKGAHKEALKSAYLIRDKISALAQIRSLESSVFQADATDQAAIHASIPTGSVDIVFTDIPYGLHSRWHGAKALPDPVWSMLEALRGVLSPWSIVAVASDKQQKASHDDYQRIEQFQIGKRRVVILKPVQHSSFAR
jgi:16S rRNA G966 N2-methylase RsmD